MSERQPSPDAPQSRELLETLLTMPGDFGNAYNRFRRYTARNIAFLALQGCPPEPVATFTRWTSLGRHVQRGQKAYSILRPIQVKIETNEDGDEVVKLIRRFKTVRALFAYSQTSGEELPQREPQAWSVERAIGELAIARIPWESYEEGDRVVIVPEDER